MRLKSYFADTVEAAIDQARTELGGEAMLVYSREACLEARHLGAYEVVFALPQTAGPAKPRETDAEPVLPIAPTSHQDLPAAPQPPWQRLTRELAELRKQVESAGRSMSRAALRAAHTDEVTAALVDADIAADLASDVSTRVEKRMSAGCDTRALILAREEMASMITTEPRLGQRTVALVGTPGAGKTTALVKLAVRYGLPGRRPTQIISMDNLRVGGAEQLRSFAAILGIGFIALDTVNALSQVLEEHQNKDLILIDTPGYGARDMDCGSELAEFLARRKEIETHLVLTASMRTADLTRVADRFRPFRPARLLFTKLDETERAGAIWSLAAHTSLPVSFLTTGQQIPEDLEEATAESILDRILPEGASTGVQEMAIAEVARAG